MNEKEKPLFDIQITPVQPNELDELADVAARSFADAFGGDMEQEDLSQSLDESRSAAYFEKSLADTKILVAKHGSKILGYVQYGPVKIPEANATADDREIGRLYVDTDQQGKGIGRQLMDAALNDPEMAHAPNLFLQVWDKNEKAIAMYESYGFKTRGITTFELAGKPVQDLIMVKGQR